MGAVLDVVLPIFGLIFAGWVAARRRILGGDATAALNRFVIWFALPAMLFLVMLRVPLDQLVEGPFLGAYLGGIVVTFAVAATWAGLALRQGPAGRIIQGLCASYANSGYMGVPLLTLAFGPDSVKYAVVAMVITAAVLFGFAVLLIETATRAEQGLVRMIGGVAKALASNPIIVAPVLGGVFALTGLPLPAAAKTFLELLGAAASPCALFALGLFIATQPLGEDPESVWWLVMAKLLLAPIATAVLAGLFGLDGVAAASAILLNALPIGAGAFVYAQAYKVQVAQVSASILITTVISLVTVSALLAVYRPVDG